MSHYVGVLTELMMEKLIIRLKANFFDGGEAMDFHGPHFYGLVLGVHSTSSKHEQCDVASGFMGDVWFRM